MSPAFWCLLIVGALPYLLLAVTGIPSRQSPSRWSGNYDNHDPRSSAGKLTGWRRRAHQAQLNSYESFPAFAAAVIIAQMQRGPMLLIDTLAIGYVALRCIYSTFYIADLATARSATWFFAMGVIVALFAVAAGFF